MPSRHTVVESLSGLVADSRPGTAADYSSMMRRGTTGKRHARRTYPAGWATYRFVTHSLLFYGIK